MIIQPLENRSRALFLGAFNRGFEIAPEITQHGAPIDLGIRDAVEIILEIGRKIVFHVFRKEALEEGGNDPALILRHQPFLLDLDVFTVTQHGERGSIGRGRPMPSSSMRLIRLASE